MRYVGLSLFCIACAVPRGGLGGTDDADVPDVRGDTSLDVPTDVPEDVVPDVFDAGCLADALRCNADTLQTCIDGEFVDTTMCMRGCNDVPTAHCRVLVPSNVGSVDFVEDALEVSTAEWDTDACDASIAPTAAATAQVGGGEVCLVRVGSLTVTETLTVRGSRPLVVVARDTITVTGELLAGASGQLGGAGGGRGADVAGTLNATGAAPGGNGGLADNFADGGGGGGGHCGAGGAGGTGGVAAGGVAGGASAPAFELIPLSGGSGGGRGGRPRSSEGGFGGGGGGAIQLSAQGIVRVDGRINVSGAGGGAGNDTVMSNVGAGGGGGSGGGVLLESLTGVEFGASAVILAGGGGGGAGASCLEGCRMGVASSDGCDGDTTPICGGVPGGACEFSLCALAGNFGATGGTGGDADDGMDGVSIADNFGNGGGGGGGAGCVVIKSETADTLPASVGVVRRGTAPVPE